MTPMTILFVIAAGAFGLCWILSMRSNAKLHGEIARRDEEIVDLKRLNFQSGTAQQRLEARLAEANKELDAFKARVKASVEDRLITDGVLAAPSPAAGEPTFSKLPPVSQKARTSAPAKLKPAPKPAPKAPAKKAAKK